MIKCSFVNKRFFASGNPACRPIDITAHNSLNNFIISFYGDSKHIYSGKDKVKSKHYLWNNFMFDLTTSFCNSSGQRALEGEPFVHLWHSHLI